MDMARAATARMAPGLAPDPIRRRLLVGGLLTAAAAGLPWAAGAQEAPEGPSQEELAAFVESMELAVAQAFDAAAGRVSGPLSQSLRTFAQHHREHARAFAAHAGGEASGEPNELLADRLADQLGDARDEQAVLAIATDVANTSAATHLSLIPLWESDALVQLAATVLPVASQHAVVLGMAAGRTGPALFPAGVTGDASSAFETQSKALDPAQFPVDPEADAGAGGEEENQ